MGGEQKRVKRRRRHSKYILIYNFSSWINQKLIKKWDGGNKELEDMEGT